MSTGSVEAEGERFGFGKNWASFAAQMPQERIDAARASLQDMLGADAVSGRDVLDIGSGSGLFSLAATELGAAKVHSFDYDPDSVATTKRLREAFAPESEWTIEQGNVLDSRYMESLGQWDVVYSWGVLHHTGAMWDAIDAACARVGAGGKLFIAIYNDQGARSRAWAWVKRTYNRLPSPLQRLWIFAFMVPLELKQIAKYTLRLRPHEYVRLWTSDAYYERGMDYWHDIVDWVGGYPFEVATPDAVFDFCRVRGLELERLRTCGGTHGLNEFVFTRAEATKA
jgi:2-polyprenyl-6-hydroxyphenyl methylase/3-demethylubiquinone-9 3-methyltransferase